MNDKKFEFDKEQAYRLVDVTDRERNSKIHANALYSDVEGCVAINLRYDRVPAENGFYRAHLDFTQDSNGQWINRGIHTSAVENVEQTEKGISIQTHNSIYIFEKAVLRETSLCEEKNSVELFLSLDETYHFAKGFYWDEEGKSRELVANIHVGTFVDTILIGFQDDSMWGNYVCRYYYGDTVRFYDTLYKQQDYSVPMLIHNTSKDKELIIEFEGYDRQWTIAPQECKKIIPFNAFGADTEQD